MKKLFVFFVVCLCTMPSVVFGEFKLSVPSLLDNSDKKSDPIVDLSPKPNFKVGLDTEKYVSEAESLKLPEKVRDVEQTNKLSNIVANFGSSVEQTLKNGSSKLDNQQKEEKQTEDNLKDEGDLLYRAMLSRSVDVNKLCVASLPNNYRKGDTQNFIKDPTECAYIHPDFGICDTHVYNKFLEHNSTNSDDIENVREMVATKITVISQQMYKQYEYLSSTLRRLRTQLQKAVLMAELEMAGGNSEKSSSGSYSRNNDKEIVLAGAQNCNNISRPAEVYRCLQENINLVRSNVQTNRNQAKKQLDKIVDSARNWGFCLESEKNGVCKAKCASYSSESEIKDCATSLSIQISRKQSKEEKDIMKYTGRQVY